MISYLEKFNNLPQGLKGAVSSEGAMVVINEIEKKYNVSLATIVMRVMVKDISIVDLAKFFVFEYEMDGKQAEALVEELKLRIFDSISGYLGFENLAPVNSPISAPASEGVIKTSKVASSNFFFSSEDEEEVSNLTQKVTGFYNKEEITAQAEEKLNKIFSKLSIEFSSEDMTKRFKHIIAIYLKGVRNKIDTRQVLQKSVETGGMGFDDLLINRVMVVVDKIKNEEEKLKPSIKAPSKITLPEDKEEKVNNNNFKNLEQSGDRDVDYDFSKFAKPKSKKKEVEIKKPIIDNQNLEKAKNETKKIPKLSKNGNIVLDLTKPEEKINKRSLSDVNNVVRVDVNKKEEKIEEDANKVIPDAINIVNVRQPDEVQGKKRMDDVKFTPKLTGPIDELKELDLINFRRLSRDPGASVARIKEKISFLEEEGYSQRLAGIKAWRESPINRLYLSIGQESISEKKGVDSVIENRQKEKRDFLTKAEFSAIMDLNKELRF